MEKLAEKSIERGKLITAPPEEAFELLWARHEGLTQDEVAVRLEQYGRNSISHTPPYPIWRLIVDQIASPLIYVLLAAGVVTLLLGKHSDSIVIFAVVVINGIVGFVQEYRATRAIEALRELAEPLARVRRSGRQQSVPSEELVPGDVLIIESGSRVPADARLVRATEVRCDESLLTGESMAVDKIAEALDDPDTVLADTVNMIFSGSMIIEGRGEALVAYTGAESELGKIATSMAEIERVETPLQQRLHSLANLVTIAILALGAVVVLMGLIRQMTLTEVFLVAVAMAVAAIPEGLPVVVTVVLSIGTKRMADRNALVRKLPAVETMGSTEVVATDKTGTLTRNRMALRALVWGPWQIELSSEGSLGCPEIGVLAGQACPENGDQAEAALEEALRVAVFCNNGEYAYDEQEGQNIFGGSPTEVALLEAAGSIAPHLLREREETPAISEVPFSSARKFMATVHPVNGERMLFAKGSTEAILARSTTEWTPEGVVELDADKWLQLTGRLAHQGQRVLALARRETSDDRISEDNVEGLTLVGLVGLLDPPRPEVPAAVAGCREAGIRVLMVTGDHPATARTIAGDVGIIDPEQGPEAVEEDRRVMTGRELAEIGEEGLDARLDEVQIYARVTPRDKLTIVEALQRKGKVVAVTGDGVNDAPALRRAHLGIAMGRSGTDAAREASDVVLMDDSFASIFEAVKQGRYIFENIRKVTFFLISSGVGLILAILAALGAGWGVPFTAAQIVWINLVTNGLQDVALAFEPGEKHLLHRKPHGLRGKFFDAVVIQHSLVVAVVFGMGVLAAFRLVGNNGDLDHARTGAMTTMVMLQMWHAFSCRSLVLSVIKKPLSENYFLVISSIAAFTAQLIVLYALAPENVFSTTYLSLKDWGIILAISAVGTIAMEVSKWVVRKRGLHLV